MRDLISSRIGRMASGPLPGGHRVSSRDRCATPVFCRFAASAVVAVLSQAHLPGVGGEQFRCGAQGFGVGEGEAFA